MGVGAATDVDPKNCLTLLWARQNSMGVGGDARSDPKELLQLPSCYHFGLKSLCSKTFSVLVLGSIPTWPTFVTFVVFVKWRRCWV